MANNLILDNAPVTQVSKGNRFSQFFNKLPLTETANVLGSLSAAFSGDNAAGRVGASVRDRTAQRLFTDFVGKAAKAINLGENPSRIASFGLTPEQRTAAINEARTQPIFEVEKGFKERELSVKEQRADAEDTRIANLTSQFTEKLSADKKASVDRNAVSKAIAKIRADSNEKIAKARDLAQAARLDTSIKFNAAINIEKTIGEERVDMAKMLLREVFGVANDFNLTAEDHAEFNSLMRDFKTESEDVRRAELGDRLGLSKNAVKAIQQQRSKAFEEEITSLLPVDDSELIAKLDKIVADGDIFTNDFDRSFRREGINLIPIDDDGIKTDDFSLSRIRTDADRAKAQGFFVNEDEKRKAVDEAKEQVRLFSLGDNISVEDSKKKRRLFGGTAAAALEKWKQYLEVAENSILTGTPLEPLPGSLKLRGVFLNRIGASSPIRSKLLR